MSAALVDVRSIILPDHPVEWPVVSAEVLALLRPKHGIFTPEQDAMLQQIARSRWFLLRNKGPEGQQWRCLRCRQVHVHFTLHCRPRPFNGLTHILTVLVERVGRDTTFSAVALGMVEPIKRDRAQRLFSDLRALGYTAETLLGV